MRILMTGGDGQLGQTFTTTLSDLGEVVALGKTHCNLSDKDSLRMALKTHHPDYVINSAAYTHVDKAEEERELCLAVNAEGPGYLAQACEEKNIPLLHISTDYVFDGQEHRPYQETDITAPLNFYGQSKRQGEENIRAHTERYINLRVSGLYSPHNRNFVKTIYRAAAEREQLSVVHDQWTCPTSTYSVAQVMKTILRHLSTNSEQNVWGTYHYRDDAPCTWYELACQIVAYHPHSTCRSITPITTADFASPAKRPAYSVLSCGKLQKTFGISPLSSNLSLQHTLQHLEQETAP